MGDGIRWCGEMGALEGRPTGVDPDGVQGIRTNILEKGVKEVGEWRWDWAIGLLNTLGITGDGGGAFAGRTHKGVCFGRSNSATIEHMAWGEGSGVE